MSTIACDQAVERAGAAVFPDQPGWGKSTCDSGARDFPILQFVFRVHRGPIILTYALFGLENLLWLAQPYVLGLAIDGLLKASYGGLLLFTCQQFGHLAVGVLRRVYDTRMFSRIHADVVSRLVLEQRNQDVAVSRIAARSALSREFVHFFERHVPVAIQTAFLLVGGLMILASYDHALVMLCIALLIPATFINASFCRKMLALSRVLHDTLEREVEVIGRGQAREIQDHYGLVASWQIKLSDSEARNFGLMDLFVLAVLAAALVRSCGYLMATPGEILSILRYVLIFAGGLDGVSILVQQTSRLRDIARRCGLPP